MRDVSGTPRPASPATESITAARRNRFRVRERARTLFFMIPASSAEIIWLLAGSGRREMPDILIDVLLEVHGARNSPVSLDEAKLGLL
jgi:hypothetical protein